MTTETKPALLADEIWRRWHGASQMPSDWDGTECFFADGTEGMPKGHQWGPFNDNMVAFYRATQSAAPASEAGELLREAEKALAPFSTFERVCAITGGDIRIAAEVRERILAELAGGASDAE